MEKNQPGDPLGLRKWEEEFQSRIRPGSKLGERLMLKYLTVRLRTGDTDTGGEDEPCLGHGLHFWGSNLTGNYVCVEICGR